MRVGRVSPDSLANDCGRDKECDFRQDRVATSARTNRGRGRYAAVSILPVKNDCYLLLHNLQKLKPALLIIQYISQTYILG